MSDTSSLQEEVRRLQAQLAEKEARLARTESLLTDLSDRLPGVLWALDTQQMKLIFLSRQAERLLCVPEAEMWANPAALFRQHPAGEEGIELLQEILQGTLTEPKRIPLPLHHTVRGEIWVEHRVYPVRDETGKLVRIAGHTQDISLRRTLADRLEMKNQELSTFIYRSAHDLRGPVSSILGLAHLAQRELEAGPAHQYLELISRTATRLDTIVRDLQQVYSFHERSLRTEAVAVHAILEQAWRSLSRTENRSHTQFDNRIPEDLVLHCDKRMMRMIFRNILENTLVHQPAHTTACTVTAAFQLSDGHCSLLIQDDGPGMPDQVSRRAAEMFYKGETRHTGPGLGLYMAQIALERCDSKLILHSAPGKGTTAELLVPDSKF